MWPWVELKDLKALLIHLCNDIVVNYRVCGHRLVGANWPQNENVNVMLLYQFSPYNTWYFRDNVFLLSVWFV